MAWPLAMSDVCPSLDWSVQHFVPSRLKPQQQFSCGFQSPVSRTSDRYTSILINIAVYTGRVLTGVLLALYVGNHDPKYIFTLEVYFPPFYTCNYSDCVWARSAARTQATYTQYCA